MKQLKYVGPFDIVTVVQGGYDREVKHGEVGDFPDDLAGRAPVGEPEDEGYDPGEGLLAQSDNWVAVTKAPAAKKDKE